MLNALTIDVEDYFHVSAFENCINPDDWTNYPLRVADNTMLILDILDEHGVKATFFILGWVAERLPELVKDVHRRGHEIASHGYGHQRVNKRPREEFREDIRKSKALLEDLTGERVLGYRAPSYSISPESLWAFDELLEAGYIYDSSVFPIRHDLYGISAWPRFPFKVIKSDNGDWIPSDLTSACYGILEIPITTLRLASKNFPIAGGGYFRFFPYLFTKWGLRQINKRECKPFVFYLHPWEIDPKQPRIIGASLKSRFRHYLNLDKTKVRFEELLSSFELSTIRELINPLIQSELRHNDSMKGVNAD